jgi:host factor-I protein
MPDRLTLKPSRQPDPAGHSPERPARPPGPRQPQERQTAFLDRNLNQPVTVYRINGIPLTGTVKQHEAFTVLLQDADGIESLVFKHAISTILPGTPVVTRERRTPFGKRPEWTG